MSHFANGKSNEAIRIIFTVVGQKNEGSNMTNWLVQLELEISRFRILLNNEDPVNHSLTLMYNTESRVDKGRKVHNLLSSLEEGLISLRE